MDTPISSLDTCLDRIKLLRNDPGSNFQPPASGIELKEAAEAVPGIDEWLKVLATANGWQFAHEDYDTRVVPAGDLAAWQERSIPATIAATYPNYRERFVTVAERQSGDTYELDRTATPLRVVLIDVETGAVAHTWPTIASFLDDALTDNTSMSFGDDTDAGQSVNAAPVGPTSLPPSMYSSASAEQPAPAAAWPPSSTTLAATSSAVWPPPPNVAPVATVPFTNNQMRSHGYAPFIKENEVGLGLFPAPRGGFVSDFRKGTLAVHGDGILIDGNAVTPIRRQYTWLLVMFFLRLWLIGAILFEVARRPASLALRWEDIDEVVFVPKSRHICLVYHELTDTGKRRTNSLTFRPPDYEYNAFKAAIDGNAPSSVTVIHAGKVHSTFASAVGYSWLTGIAIAIVVSAVFEIVSYGSRMIH
ncbi:MAG TPA: hypothetical protein VGK19_19585 [Capsulimonadaceae bacterium]|jgi:hypothetical protein